MTPIEIERGLADLIKGLDDGVEGWREYVKGAPSPFASLHDLCDANMLFDDRIIELITNKETEQRGLAIANGIIEAFDDTFRSA